MTLTPEVRDTRRRESPPAPKRPAPARKPAGVGRPVEFWPTAAIRAALETDDLTVWQRIVVAIKRSSGQMQFNPSPEDRLEAGDQLVVLGDAGQLKALDEAARGTGARVTRR